MRFLRRAALALLLAASCSFVLAQQQPAPATQPAPTQSAQQSATDQDQNAASRAASQGTPGAQLAEASKEAAGEENSQFKHSPVVRWVSSHLGISPAAEYWVLYSLDFAIIAVAIVWFWKSNIPAMFRMRTETIRKGMDEARRASDDATRRLTEVESRLARLDAEIAEMRSHAEQETAAEEQRIRQAAEAEKQKIISGAEMEIEAAAKQARRELKAFAAGLAVTLAEQRIQVDEGTDRALVHSFVDELGRNGGGN